MQSGFSNDWMAQWQYLAPNRGTYVQLLVAYLFYWMGIIQGFSSEIGSGYGACESLIKNRTVTSFNTYNSAHGRFLFCWGY